MAAGNGRNGDIQNEGKFDKQEQVNFKQAEGGAHERFIAQIASAANAGDNIAQAGDAAKWGPTKDGGFVPATADQLAGMSDKEFAKYVGDHDNYVQAQVASHPARLEKIVAQYSGSLGDDLAKQTQANVEEFYGKLGKAIQA